MRISARKIRRGEGAREWDGLKANHVAPRRGWISCERMEGDLVGWRNDCNGQQNQNA